MSDRRAAIELKRAKLLALRQETQLRREAHEKEAAEAVDKCAKAIKKGVNPITRRDRENVDALLSTLDGGASGCDAGVTVDDLLPVRQQDDSEAGQSDGPGRLHTGSDVVCLRTKQKRKAVLSMQTQAATSFPPREQITYSKHTQTSSEIPKELEPPASPDKSIKSDCKAALSPAQPAQPTPNNKPLVGFGKPVERPLTEKEQALVMASDGFRTFFERSSKLVERALGERVDIFKDYTEVVSTTDDSGQSQLLTLSRSFSLKGLNTSVVSSIDWSTQFPELFLASYSLDRIAANNEEGRCLIWNMMYGKETPEHSFKCSTQVVASKFAVFHPNLVLGGTYSGQIVLWDTRERKRLPVLQSMLWLTSHTQPVFSLNLIGGQHSHNLVSTSSDSSVCVWSLDMLTRPQQIIDLSVRGGVTVAPTCVDFPKEETNNFVIGAEEGSIYYASLSGETPGVTHHFTGHTAPISGISAASGYDSERPANTYLTSSFDWSVKLWSAKEAEPLHTFSYYGDVVYDVKWSPTHPAVFATADGDGQLQIWNLSMPNHDCLDVPVATALIDGAPALNKVAWAKTGMQVAVGDDHGRVWVYDVNKKLATPSDADLATVLKTFRVAQPKREDLREIAKGIAKLKTHLTKDEKFPRPRY